MTPLKITPNTSSVYNPQTSSLRDAQPERLVTAIYDTSCRYKVQGLEAFLSGSSPTNASLTAFATFPLARGWPKPG